ARRRPSTLSYTDGGVGSDARPLPPAEAVAPSRAGARGKPRAAATRLLLHFQRVFDGVEGGELDIVKLAVDLLDFADIDVLDDLARLRVNGNRPARAFPFHSLHRGGQGLSVGLALGLLERLVDEVHAVVAAERDEVRPVSIRLLEGGDIFLVHR